MTDIFPSNLSLKFINKNKYEISFPPNPKTEFYLTVKDFLSVNFYILILYFQNKIQKVIWKSASLREANFNRSEDLSFILLLT